MPHRVLPCIVALIVLAWAVPARAEDFTGKVVGVSDGDTLTVLRERTPVKVRVELLRATSPAGLGVTYPRSTLPRL